MKRPPLKGKRIALLKSKLSGPQHMMKKKQMKENC